MADSWLSLAPSVCPEAEEQGKVGLASAFLQQTDSWERPRAILKMKKEACDALQPRPGHLKAPKAALFKWRYSIQFWCDWAFWAPTPTPNEVMKRKIPLCLKLGLDNQFLSCLFSVPSTLWVSTCYPINSPPSRTPAQKPWVGSFPSSCWCLPNLGPQGYCQAEQVFACRKSFRFTELSLGWGISGN